MTEGIDKTQPMREAEIAIADWINEHKEDVVNETARAKAAEQVLQNNINTETNRAKAAESTLTTSINNEVTRAKAAESTLTTNLNTEVTRAKGAESTLTTNLNAEVTRAKGAESTLTTSISDEVTRAKSAESTLTTNLATETTRATQAESGLQAAINSEYTRANTAETGLNTAITAVNNRFPVKTADIGDEQVTEAKLDGTLQSELSFLRTIPGFEFGYSEAVSVPASGTTSVEITFKETFASTPQVFTEIMCNTLNNILVSHVTYVDTKKATIKLYNGGVGAVSNVTVDYLAIGGR